MLRYGALGIPLLAISAWGQPEPGLLQEGKVQYATCITCHGVDGKGVRVDKLTMAPSLLDSNLVRNDSAGLALVVLKGIKKESPKYVQEMLTLEEVLDDRKLAAVLTYVRHTFAGHEDTITPEQTRQWREQFSSVSPSLARGAVNRTLIETLGIKHLVKNLGWTEYRGAWKTLPDFGDVEPYREGVVRNGLITLAMSKTRRGIGMVFSSTLQLPEKDDYEFAITSNGGSDLWINGTRVIDNDGVHGLQTKSGRITLTAGAHEMKVRYVGP
ncbi:MAG: PA14 domain-containing protein, partial [Verrucomicrobiota bacterium]